MSAAVETSAQPALSWRRRLVQRLLFGQNVDRSAKSRARVGLAILIFSIGYAVIAGRLIQLAAAPDNHTVRRAADAVSTARPDILDRNGEILATDVKAASLFGEPRKIIDVDEAVELLTAVLPDLDATELRERLSSKKGFVWLKREITPKQQKEIHGLGIPGIGFLTENRRIYPNGRGGFTSHRPGEHRQPGHRRHREVAGRAGPRRPAHGGSRRQPDGKTG